MGNSFDASRISKFEIEHQSEGGYWIRTDGTDRDNTAALRALTLLTAARPLLSKEKKPSFDGPALYHALEIYCLQEDGCDRHEA